MTRRTSHVRGELKTKMRALTASYFGFRTSQSITAIKQNRDLAETLKDESRFVFKVLLTWLVVIGCLTGRVTGLGDETWHIQN